MGNRRRDHPKQIENYKTYLNFRSDSCSAAGAGLVAKQALVAGTLGTGSQRKAEGCVVERVKGYPETLTQRGRRVSGAVRSPTPSRGGLHPTGPHMETRGARKRRGGGGGGHQDNVRLENGGVLVGWLLDKLPDVFQMAVLPLLDPTDRALLGRASRVCRDAVGPSWDVKLSVKAFLTSVEMIAWAKDNRCPWTAMTCAHVAGVGQLEALRWAREHDCPWGTWTCARAAHGGHLEVLKWAREQQCPWNEGTMCEWAAQGGHLEVLRWAREHHAPWDETKVVHEPLRTGTWRC